LQHHRNPLYVLLRLSSTFFNYIHARNIPPFSHGQTISHSRSNSSSSNSLSCSSTLASPQLDTLATQFEREQLLLLMPSASPKKTSNSLVDGEATLSMGTSMSCKNNNQLRKSSSHLNNFSPPFLINLSWHLNGLLAPPNPRNRRLACRDLQRDVTR